MIDLLPPRINVELNAKLRLRILSGVLKEMTEACGVFIESTINKGILERDILKEIIVKFYDQPNHICGKIIFEIDWDKFEFLAKTKDGEVLYSNIDMSKNLSKQLDRNLFDAVKIYVDRTKKKYSVIDVQVEFRYRDKYRTSEEVHQAAREYMGHVKHTATEIDEENEEFKNEIIVGMNTINELIVHFKTL